MYSTEQLHRIIESECKSLPLDQQPKELFAPIKYIMEDGGKRMRPMLTLLSTNIFTEDITHAKGAAMAIEIFHNFTLLHDDIMDRAPMRRGRETVHVKWNENSAILSGDAMFSLAYHALCHNVEPTKLHELINEFNKVTLQVCQGQQYDMDFEHQSAVSLDEYTEMIRLKTAVLMASGIKMGAIAAGATPKQQSDIYNFGINLGLAFQIQDDMLDTYGDSSTFGKTIGGDIAAGKQTFLMICAKNLANKEQKVVLNSSRNLLEVKAIYDALGIKEQAQKAIETYFSKAIHSLELCCEDIGRLEPMKEYSMALLNRKK